MATRPRVQVSAALGTAEVDALSQAQLGRATNRSVLGSVHEFRSAVEAWLRTRPAGDLDALGLGLCDTPCPPLQSQWPWLGAGLLLVGSVAPGRRPLEFPAHVI